MALSSDEKRNSPVSGNEADDGSGAEHRLVCDNNGRLIVSAIAWPLPAGGSTSANQATIIGHLNALDDALQSIGTDHL